MIWTDHVADRGITSQESLGPPAQQPYPGPRIPYVKIWVFAVLSCLVFRWRSSKISTSGLHSTLLILPLCILFAVLCWQAVDRALAVQRQRGGPTGSLLAARVVSLVLVGIMLLGVVGTGNHFFFRHENVPLDTPAVVPPTQDIVRSDLPSQLLVQSGYRAVV